MPPRTVPNEGSTARDHLANERTYLAWYRTALGLVGLGVVVEKLQLEGPLSARLVGLGLIGFGGAVVLYAMNRYHRVSHALEQGSFPPARRGPLVFGGGALVVALVAALYLLLG